MIDAPNRQHLSDPPGTQEMLRVLHVIPSVATATGGPAASVVGAAKALRERGVDSRIFTTDAATPTSVPHRGRLHERDVPGGSLQGIEVFARPASAWASIHRRACYAPELKRGLRRSAREFDLIHIHSLFLYPQMAAYRVARAADVPYVVSPRGALDPLLWKRGAGRKRLTHELWQKTMLANADALHYTSTLEAARASRYSAVRYFVIPNGVDCPLFENLPDPNGARSRLRLSNEPVLSFMGRLTSTKGVDLLVRAVGELRAHGTQIQLLVAGPDERAERERLERLAHAVGCPVTFTGIVEGPQKLDVLSATDIWALPSAAESFSNAAVEALAAGRTVVLTPEVPIAADAHAAGAAHVVDREPKALARAFGELLADEGRRVELGTRARLFARRYEWSRIASDLEDMYRTILADRRCAGERG